MGMIILILALIFAILSATVIPNSMRFTVNGQPTDEITNSMKVGTVIGAIIMTAIAFFPLFFLLQFAGKMRTALAANEQDGLNEAFLNLKKYFRYLGIIVIIVLVLYACIFIVAIISGGLGSR